MESKMSDHEKYIARLFLMVGVSLGFLIGLFTAIAVGIIS